MLKPQIFQQQIFGYHLITVILFYVIYVTLIFSYVRLIFGHNKHIFVAMIKCCATVHVLYWIKLVQFDWCEIRLSYKITNKLYLTTIYNEIDGSKKSIFRVYEFYSGKRSINLYQYTTHPVFIFCNQKYIFPFK